MIPRTIARYGVRSVPGDEKVIVAAFRRGEAVSGPAIAEFEGRFADYHRLGYATATSFGRMAFHYILRALDFLRERNHFSCAHVLGRPGDCASRWFKTRFRGC